MSASLTWPGLARPASGLLYLDLNHYINLAKVKAAVPGVSPVYGELHDALVAAVQEGRLVVPLSSDHVFELSHIKDPRQRHAIARVMEEISQFRYLLGRTQITEEEIDAGIRRFLGEHPIPVPLPLIRETFAHAFGMRGGVSIVGEDGTDRTEPARLAMGDVKYAAFMRRSYLEFERGILAGPTDGEAARMRIEYGYAPEKAHEGRESRLAFEVELTTILRDQDEWRRGRLRDVVAAREFVHEWLDALNRANRSRAETGRPQFDADDDQFLVLVNSMPHSQVAISVKTRYHKNPRHNWTVNDISDIDAVSVAYAYCDAVFTDKAVRNAVMSSKELRAIPTFMPQRPQDVIEWIRGLPVPALGTAFQIAVSREAQ
jgi:hypothetical protein